MKLTFPDRLRAVARVFWLACGIFLWLFWLASVPLFLQRASAGTLPTTIINGLSPAQMASEGASAWGADVPAWSWINVVVGGSTFLVFSLVAFLVWQRVRTGFGLLTAYVLLGSGSNFMNVAIYSAELSVTAIAVWELGAIIWPLFFIWLYFFPNGRAVPRRLLWALGPLLALFTFLYILYALTIFLEDNSVLFQVVSTLEPFMEILVLPMLFMVIVAQVYRYIKVSGAVEKKQTKWFIYGLVIAFVPPMLADFAVDYPTELDTLAFMALPLGIGISILRYRLFEIDVIIRKTLVYAVLTGLLVLIYFGSVLLMQSLFETLTSQRSPIVIVISTLMIATLFDPLRRRVQAFIDRRFFRRKYDAEQALSGFAVTLRGEMDIERLEKELLAVVQETMQPEGVNLWLKTQRGKQ